MPMRHARLDFSRLRPNLPPPVPHKSHKKIKARLAPGVLNWRRCRGREGKPRSCDGPNWGLLGAPQSPLNPKISLAGRPSTPWVSVGARGAPRTRPGRRAAQRGSAALTKTTPRAWRSSQSAAATTAILYWRCLGHHASSKSTAPVPAHAYQDFPRSCSGQRLLWRPFQKENGDKKGGRCRTRVAGCGFCSRFRKPS
jgi:hypothetical protein